MIIKKRQKYTAAKMKTNLKNIHEIPIEIFQKMIKRRKVNMEEKYIKVFL